MGKIKMTSGNPQPEQPEQLIVPKLPKVDKIEPGMVVGHLEVMEPAKNVVCSCVCPVEIPAMSQRIDDVMSKVTQLQSEPKNQDTKIDSYIKSNNETLKQMSDDLNKLKTKVDMAKGEVKVVENVVECRHKDQNEKRQEIGLEVDRLSQKVLKDLRTHREEKEELVLQNEKLQKLVKVAITASVLVTIINIFI